ncbi:hypothetical protein ACFOYW_18300 [Gryllotalpicola reticulitermitis]|uniref:DUF1444 family protein n=1 Tax=Gryllotalpicola reticulitermitis TaxID=1184153 RepID=A0ABV8QAI4_9MICO
MREINAHIATLPVPKEVEPGFRQALEDEIFDEYLEALAEGVDVHPITARFIAYGVLADAPGNATTEALSRYVTSGEGSHKQLREEYLPLYWHPQTGPRDRVAIDVLGTHLFRHEQQTNATLATPLPLNLMLLHSADDPTEIDTILQVPKDLTLADAQPVINEALHHASVKGDAFKAFLRLPAVDVTADNLLSEFDLAFVGSSDRTDFDSEVLPLMKRRAEIGLEWDAIELGGKTYVFAR